MVLFDVQSQGPSSISNNDRKRKVPTPFSGMSFGFINLLINQVIQRLRRDTRRGVETAADRVGLNLAALDVLQRRLDERHAVQLFSDASEKVKNKRGKRQRKDQATRRALLTL